MRAKKSLGQNFLTSTQIVHDVVSAAHITEGGIVLEIGPGKGILTREILKQGGRVVAVEKDPDLIPVLTELFSEEISLGSLTLIEGDVLQPETFDVLPLQKNTYKVIANIPYYITGQILRTILSHEKHPSSATLIVQKEVAERIVRRDTKESILSLSVNVYGDTSYVRKIASRYFKPKPKVDSAVIHIDHISRKVFHSKAHEDLFFQLVKTGFAHKRKLLIRNLSVLFDRDVLQFAFSQSSIPQNTRAEDVSLEKWLILTEKLLK